MYAQLLYINEYYKSANIVLTNNIICRIILYRGMTKRILIVKEVIDYGIPDKCSTA